MSFLSFMIFSSISPLMGWSSLNPGQIFMLCHSAWAIKLTCYLLIFWFAVTWRFLKRAPKPPCPAYFYSLVNICLTCSSAKSRSQIDTIFLYRIPWHAVHGSVPWLEPLAQRYVAGLSALLASCPPGRPNNTPNHPEECELAPGNVVPNNTPQT